MNSESSFDGSTFRMDFSYINAIVGISLRTFLEILINASTNFESTFQDFFSIGINARFFFQCDGNLFEKYDAYTEIHEILKQQNDLTLKHSIAVPASWWNAVLLPPVTADILTVFSKLPSNSLLITSLTYLFNESSSLIKHSCSGVKWRTAAIFKSDRSGKSNGSKSSPNWFGNAWDFSGFLTVFKRKVWILKSFQNFSRVFFIFFMKFREIDLQMKSQKCQNRLDNDFTSPSQ